MNAGPTEDFETVANCGAASVSVPLFQVIGLYEEILLLSGGIKSSEEL